MTIFISDGYPLQDFREVQKLHRADLCSAVMGKPFESAIQCHSSFPVPSKDEVNGNVIYILGGTQDSLKLKYALAADLYLHERAGKIMILGRPGITEYDQKLQRNLTNDEWSVKQLMQLGVAKEDIEVVFLQEGFFGTMSEARGVSSIMTKRGMRKLLLVCAAYHAERVGISFSAFKRDTYTDMEIHSVDEKTSVYGRLIEKIKLLLYKYVLVPFEVRSEGAEKAFCHSDNADDNMVLPIHACISLIR